MHGNVILILLFQIFLILLLSRVVGMVFRYLRQPQVMGEMIAGIMLGPSLFPALSKAIFPPESVALLNILSQLGVIFFLFLVGLELDPKLLKNRGRQAVVISHASIMTPFLLGAGLTLYLYPRLFNNAPRMPFTSVALFMGAAMSITAFPVLARILTERNIHKTKTGAIAITCAAVDDVTAWCILAFVVGIARADGWRPGLRTALLAVIYIAVMFLVIQPLLRRLQLYHDRQGRLSQTIIAIIFLLVLASAYTTESIGIHALFGAFLMGAIMPKGTRFIRTISEKLDDYTVVLLLPIFFAYTGLRTQIGLLNSPDLWLDTLLITAVACVGKFGGSTLAGLACGLPLRESSVIGILMNTRGLMELVILNIGLQEGVITPAVFAMMIIMALVTTALTTPILHWIYPPRLFEAEKAPAEAKPRFSILLPVALPESGITLARLAGYLLGNHDGRVLALHLRRPTDHEAYRTGLDAEPVAGDDPALTPLLDQAHAQKIDAEPISLVSRDIANDIAALARARNVNLVVMGFHKPVFGATILGGKVHRVLMQCPTDVAILVDRGLERVAKILVPFTGTPHDRLAMELAGRIGRNIAAAVTVLHVVSPKRESDATKLHAKTIVEKTFSDPTQPTPVTFRAVADESPVDCVLREAATYDLVVIGIGEEFGLESHLIGFRPERLVSECVKPLLIARKHQ
ncbi:MAG TPA: cation:proton antiporter [Tepidisphaeraceae bacterium]|jgi:Kef-type K+ transport system membrane component KefB|nr:cation:proton antiporter [Tepidisphaeraceae bacterium]